MPQRRGWRRG
jgi:hypothetical protein